MKRILNMIIKRTPLHQLLKIRKAEREIAQWKREGKPVPPPHVVKQRTLMTFAQRFGLRILVETGTYYGDMIEATRKKFDQIYSIELSQELFERAKERFRGDNHIELIHGDSGIELMKLMKKIRQPALFWLDGHYSAGVTARGAKDTPINEELNHILNAPAIGHVIIIDDARCFGRDPAYPGINQLTALVQSKRPNASISILDDSIRITSI